MLYLTRKSKEASQTQASVALPNNFAYRTKSNTSGATPQVRKIQKSQKRKEKHTMARLPQITRTITSTNVKALCVNTELQTLETLSFTLPRTYKDDKEILKMIVKLSNNDVIVPTKVLEKEEVQTLYMMYESDFIKYAKPVENAEADDETEVEG